jgi:hypothetical protein
MTIVMITQRDQEIELASVDLDYLDRVVITIVSFIINQIFDKP